MSICTISGLKKVIICQSYRTPADVLRDMTNRGICFAVNCGSSFPQASSPEICFFLSGYIISFMSRTPTPPGDLERGNINGAGMCHSFSNLSLLILQMCTVDGHDRLNQPPAQPTQDGPPQSPQGNINHGDINYGDSSWPLYAIYSKIVQEEDNKIAENHQKSADGILIFVSPRVAHPFLCTSIKYRPVYSLPPLPRCLQSQFQT